MQSIKILVDEIMNVIVKQKPNYRQAMQALDMVRLEIQEISYPLVYSDIHEAFDA